MQPYLVSSFTLSLLFLLTSCETTLPEWKRLEILEDTERVLVLDRHSLYAYETENTLEQGVAVGIVALEPMHPPFARNPMPRWLEEFDTSVYLRLERGIRERGETDWSYESVFPTSPLPPAYSDNPFDTTDLWPEPLAAEKVTQHAKDFDAETVLILEFIAVVLNNNTYITRDPKTSRRTFEPNASDRFLDVHLRCGFRTYNGSTGEPFDQAEFAQPNYIPWNQFQHAPPPSTIDFMKTGLSGEALEEIIKHVDRSLIARDIVVK
ncbi:hypothetical protein VDG1235_4467 [Verrucomicrobiia bacterium DG1235]|nr:hypothetical protein VDG1235_4467 [Verrucomicrobiae bacterium DG1235]